MTSKTNNEACPGCGCLPGAGRTAGCQNLLGCGGPSDESNLEVIEMVGGQYLIVRHVSRVKGTAMVGWAIQGIRLPGVFKKVAAFKEARRVAAVTGEPVTFSGRQI